MSMRWNCSACGRAGDVDNPQAERVMAEIVIRAHDCAPAWHRRAVRSVRRGWLKYAFGFIGAEVLVAGGSLHKGAPETLAFMVGWGLVVLSWWAVRREEHQAGAQEPGKAPPGGTE